MWNQNWGTMIWTQAAPVPALSFWGLLLLGAALGILGVRFLKGRRPRTIGLAALAIALFIPIAARAGLPPFTFVNGTPADANQMNASLQAATVVSANGGSVTAGATKFCGVGPVMTDGRFNFGGATGYQAARKMCQDPSTTGCSPAGAHMCTAPELVLSAQLGITISSGWYSTGTLSNNAPGNNGIDDCSGAGGGAGWNTNSTGWGAVWAAPGFPTVWFDQCSAQHAVLCCN
jgi:hypothetical protein